MNARQRIRRNLGRGLRILARDFAIGFLIAFGLSVVVFGFIAGAMPLALLFGVVSGWTLGSFTALYGWKEWYE